MEKIYINININIEENAQSYLPSEKHKSKLRFPLFHSKWHPFKGKLSSMGYLKRHKSWEGLREGEELGEG